MIGFLRFLGVANAAIWFGSAIFFTFVGAPALFSPEMQNLLGKDAYPFYAGSIAQIVLERYFILHHICGVVALVHMVAEWLYLGRSLTRIRLWVVLGVFGLGLVGGFWLQPKLQALHTAMYHGPAAEREQVRRSFQLWHGTAQATNLVMMVGLLFYLWRISRPNPPKRPWFVGTGNFRG